MTSVRLFVLGALADFGPMHGYQIRQLAETGTAHLWSDFRANAIYGAIQRLLAEGLIERVSTEAEGSRPARQIVQMTEVGRRDLEHIQSETLTHFKLAVDPFDLALVQAAEEVVDELPALLHARRAALISAIEEHDSRSARVQQDMNQLERNVMAHQAYRLRGELEWLESVISSLSNSSDPGQG